MTRLKQEPVDECFFPGEGAYLLPVRREVAEFALAMEAKLAKNDHKTDWKSQPVEAHVRLLDIERMEFGVALEFFSAPEAATECVDIANFALIIRDKLLHPLNATTPVSSSRRERAAPVHKGLTHEQSVPT